jgi:hypothetical protein
LAGAAQPIIPNGIWLISVADPIAMPVVLIKFLLVVFIIFGFN